MWRRRPHNRPARRRRDAAVVRRGGGEARRWRGAAPVAPTSMGACVRSIEANDFICLIVRDPSMCLRRLSRVRRTMAGGNLAIGFTELNPYLAGVTTSTDELLRLIAWHTEGPHAG